MKKMNVTEKEARQVDGRDGVQSFPTIVLYKRGRERKRIEGSRDKGEQIINELGLRSRRGRTYRGKRKTRNRTLRNYKSFA
jgi:hypothetical protein